MTGTNGNGNGAKIGTDKVKQGLAQMLKGGVIVSSKDSFVFGARFLHVMRCALVRWACAEGGS